MRRLIPAWLFVCLYMLSVLAHAASTNVSYSTWDLSSARIITRIVLPASVAQQMAGSSLRLVIRDKLRNSLLDDVGISTNGKACTALDQGWDLGRVDPVIVDTGYYGFEIFFKCSGRNNLVLENHIAFDADPHHVDFATIETTDGTVNQVFTSDRQTIQFSSLDTIQPAGIGQYVRLGVAHRLNGIDELCLLFGLFLLARRRRDVGYVFAGLVGGGVLSLVESIFGNLVPRTLLLQGFTGFLVMLTAITLMARELPSEQRTRVALFSATGLLVLAVAALIGLGGPSTLVLFGGALLLSGCVGATPQKERGNVLLLVLLSALFGFLDGYVLSGKLTPLGLPGTSVASMSLGFELGTWLIDAAFLALLVVLASFVLPRWRRFRPPRALVHDALVAGLGGLGAFWFISQLPA